MEHSLERVITALFLLFIFLLPWQTQWIIKKGNMNGEPFEYGTLSLYVTDILLWLIAGLFILWLLRQQSVIPAPVIDTGLTPAGIQKRKKFLWLIVIASFVYAIISTKWTESPLLAIFTWISILESLFIILFLVRFPIPLSRVIQVLLFAATIQALLAISQIATQIIPASTISGIALHEPWQGGSAVIETGTTRLLRAYGSLPHPNVLGGFLALTLFLCLAYASQKKVLTARHALLFITTMPLTLGLFFSFSRSAWLSFTLGTFFFTTMLLHHRKEHISTQEKLFPSPPHNSTSLYSLKIIIAIIAVTSVIVGFFGRDLIMTRLLASGRLEHASFDERVLTYQEAWTLFKAHPLRGVGLGNYTPALAQVFPQKPVFEYQPVHNVFLLILVELGSIGFSLIVLALVFFFIHLRRVLRKTPPARVSSPLDKETYWTPAFLAILGIFTVLLSLDHYLWSLHFGRLFFSLILGLFVSCAIQGNLRHEKNFRTQ